ncbi:monosaccharide ABC transporter membrane protein (CUT2 family) [Microcella alkaliphila]|uniref:Monosaccharide ABC transporter membrane protein (CUT2 family) n=1 Tax=Microcella alkaliphila TaxID=279828 RepID=A0A4Q7TJU1_9MICO|nr:ABC transporter permease [Microcella alkaliphila]RZT60904.1 monosaccharide ABC transporter membrane protein (CUT2 family) [Microcella alkaliphila]
MTTLITPTNESSSGPWGVKRLQAKFRDFGIVFGLLAIVLGLSVSTTTFLTPGNLINLVDQATVVGLLAVGATLCIISGVFDLSATATLAVSAITGIWISQTFGFAAGFIGAIVAGVLLGTITGLIIVSTKINSFIGTLAISIIYRGLAIVLTAGAIVSPPAEIAESFRFFAERGPFGLTWASILFGVTVVVLGLMLSQTTYGRRIYAVGGNAEAARLSGIRTGAVRVGVFAISGACSALAGLVLISRAGSAQPGMATGLELTAIAAVVIGGTSIMGGQGAVWRAFVGVMILTVIANGFNLLQWDTTYQQVVTGALILIAIAADSLFFKKRNS